MVNVLRYIFLFLPLILLSCGKNEFVLNFDLSPDVTDTYNVTYYATDLNGGITVQAVASVRDGKCELSGFTKKPTLIYVTQRRGIVPLVIYTQKGEKLEISGNGKDPLAWKVRGNEINEKLSEWVNQNIDCLKENNIDSINAAVRDFVNENIASPVSTILMLCYYHRYNNEREYAELMHSLEGEAHDNKWLSMVGRSDQLYHFYSFPAALQSMVMKAVNNDKDTIYINHRDPLFMFFWQLGDNDKKNIVDSIKILTNEFPDSSLLLADVCLDADSAGWRNSIRRDSLENIKRFWAPFGMADAEIQKFKVDAIPFFIVFDKDGHQYYRGTDLSRAMEDYRKLYNSKDSVVADSIK